MNSMIFHNCVLHRMLTMNGVIFQNLSFTQTLIIDNEFRIIDVPKFSLLNSIIIKNLIMTGVIFQKLCATQTLILTRKLEL